MDKLTIIKDIVQMEWKMFQRVQNEGGRAACQEDALSFVMARGAQFLVWNLPTLESYRQDLHRAGEQGRNLLTEKYARMMRFTDPAGYKQIAPHLAPLPRSVEKLAEEIVAIQSAWQQQQLKKQPGYAAQSRPAGPADGTKSDTTHFEGYLLGELLTYSEATLTVYLQYLRALQARGQTIFTHGPRMAPGR